MTAGQQWKRLGINGGTKFQIANSLAPRCDFSAVIMPLNSVTVSVPATLSLLTAATRSPGGETKLAERCSAPQCGIGSSYGDVGWKIKLAPERILESSGADAAGDSVFAALSGSGPRRCRQRQ